ncbi:MAG: NAD-glutamate dehydrogenase [Actinomycetota bacterium]
MQTLATDTTLAEAVAAQIGTGLEPDRRHQAGEFARAYLRRIPPDDRRTTEEWLAEVRGVFDFVNVRTDEVAVRVFNPEAATDGYSSNGTAVEVSIEDSPFLLDSVSNEIQAHGLEVVRVTHPVLGITRDHEGRIQSIGDARHARHKESVEHYELDRRLFDADLPGLERSLRGVLADVRAAVRDFHQMNDRINRMSELARGAAGFFPEAEVGEAIALLQWLRDNNFIFLGYREYRVVDTDGRPSVMVVPESGLGILGETSRSKLAAPVPLDSLRPELAARYTKGELLVITKTNRLSTVHRRAKLDYFGVRIIGPTGATVGEARMVGLFTSKAFMAPASHVPILRRKLAEIVSKEDLIEGSHDHKAVIQIFEGFSKHDLFTAPTAELRKVIMGLLALQETHHVRLFVRRDLLERSVSILVALPRDRFNADLRKKLQDLFMRRYNGMSVDYHLELGEADPAQIHFTVWVEGAIPEVAYGELEGEVLALTRTWTDRLTEKLEETWPPNVAKRVGEQWSARFPDYYKVSAPLASAAEDVAALDELSRVGGDFLVGLRNEVEAGEDLTRVLLYRSDGKQPLSELVPALEDLGLRVIEEVPTRISGGGQFFLHDFGVTGIDDQPLDLSGCQDRVSQALTAVWAGTSESDELNRLVITANLTHWEVGILRAYRVYQRRISPSFTVGYLTETINAYPEVASDLIHLFRAKFEPREDSTQQDSPDPAPIKERILTRLDAIPSLDQDRILRGLFRLIEATLRTNAFRPGRVNLAFKLRSADVPDMPAPIPFAEIFVYGPAMEGIHLRAGPVARGGLRWSDRREDYRTEVLGLMKAQVTKNAVIVPTGAKGGFVLRKPPAQPAQILEEVRTQYESYIRALLDVTDNLVKGEAVHPERVLAHDGSDPYLVVAADRGTATFSDLANAIAAEYGFWLDDAFASGGSAGYDHKVLGITARGAWRSLERHFLELGIDPHREPITVIGIGDMSGDVFGNGMLGSDKMKVIAAFDHRHILIDPDPDPTASYLERQRLFGLPRSSWDDYDRTFLSEGGGVFPRTAKQIQLPPRAQAALGVDQSTWTPNRLINAVLKAPVDLFWNGGIGTYVKASTEGHEMVGDRANDAVRVDASELRCRVVVEGGNLGLTQAARVEYALAGGKVNTDFIDNSGGVNCSDREVNLKILLGLAEQRGELTRPDRDKLVAGAADEVVQAILYDNFQQAQMLSQEEGAALRRISAHEHLMVELEQQGILDRKLEGVPSTELLAERGRNGRGLTRPELAVLLVDAKRSIYESLVVSDLIDDPMLLGDLRRYFPNEAFTRFSHLIPEHPLRRELTATLLANDVVNSLGVTFVSRMIARSGAIPAAVVKAYRIARDISVAQPRWEAIERLVDKVDLPVWLELMTGADRVVASLARHYLAHPHAEPLTEIIEADLPGFAAFEEALAEVGTARWPEAIEAEEARLVEAGVPVELARRHLLRRQLVHAPNAFDLAAAFDRKVPEVAEIMFAAGEVVGLDRLERLAAGYTFTDSWQRWALEALEDDMVGIRSRLTKRVLQAGAKLSPAEALDRFVTEHSAGVGRLSSFLKGLGTDQPDNLAPLMIGVRQLRALVD